MQGTVSVIMPVYNRENLLQESIKSVLEQTYQNFEIILVDDGSTDNTALLCEKLSQSDKRIKFFKTEHKCVSVARNLALNKAVGEFIFFLDSDDYIHPKLFEVSVSSFNTTDASVVATGVLNVGQQNWNEYIPQIIAKSPKSEVVYKPYKEIINQVFIGENPLNCIGGVMMRKSLIGDTLFNTDLFIGEDFYFIYENIIKNAHCVFLKEKWYYVRIHNENSSWKYDYNAFWTRFYRRELVWKSEESFGRIENANILKRQAVGIFAMCVNKNKPDSAEVKKMRETMKAYHQVLKPAFKNKRLLYYLSVKRPYLLYKLVKFKKKLKSKILS